MFSATKKFPNARRWSPLLMRRCRNETRRIDVDDPNVDLYALLVAAHFAPARAEELDQPAWAIKEWLTSTPEEQGMDSSALAKLVNYGESHSFDSLLVVRHGRIVAEAYYAPYAGEV